jgi:hypothetical protein
MGRTRNTNGEKRNAYKIFVGKPEEKCPIRRSSKGIILNMILDRRGGIYWMDLAQNRDKYRAIVNMVMNLRVP